MTSSDVVLRGGSDPYVLSHRFSIRNGVNEALRGLSYELRERQSSMQVTSDDVSAVHARLIKPFPKARIVNDDQMSFDRGAWVEVPFGANGARMAWIRHHAKPARPYIMSFVFGAALIVFALTLP